MKYLLSLPPPTFFLVVFERMCCAQRENLNLRKKKKKKKIGGRRRRINSFVNVQKVKKKNFFFYFFFCAGGFFLVLYTHTHKKLSIFCVQKKKGREKGNTAEEINSKVSVEEKISTELKSTSQQLRDGWEEFERIQFHPTHSPPPRNQMKVEKKIHLLHSTMNNSYVVSHFIIITLSVDQKMYY